MISGQHILADDYSNEPGGIPYLTGPADANGKIVVTKYTSSPKVVCEPGDILLTVKGSGTGKVVKASQYCISRKLMAIRVTKWTVLLSTTSWLIAAKAMSKRPPGLIPGI